MGVWQNFKRRLKSKYVKADVKLGGYLPGGKTPKEVKAEQAAQPTGSQNIFQQTTQGEPEAPAASPPTPTTPTEPPPSEPFDWDDAVPVARETPSGGVRIGEAEFTSEQVRSGGVAQAVSQAFEQPDSKILAPGTQQYDEAYPLTDVPVGLSAVGGFGGERQYRPTPEQQQRVAQIESIALTAATAIPVGGAFIGATRIGGRLAMGTPIVGKAVSKALASKLGYAAWTYAPAGLTGIAGGVSAARIATAPKEERGFVAAREAAGLYGFYTGAKLGDKILGKFVVPAHLRVERFKQIRELEQMYGKTPAGVEKPIYKKKEIEFFEHLRLAEMAEPKLRVREITGITPGAKPFGELKFPTGAKPGKVARTLVEEGGIVYGGRAGELFGARESAPFKDIDIMLRGTTPKGKVKAKVAKEAKVPIDIKPIESPVYQDFPTGAEKLTLLRYKKTPEGVEVHPLSEFYSRKIAGTTEISKGGEQELRRWKDFPDIIRAGRRLDPKHPLFSAQAEKSYIQASEFFAGIHRQQRGFKSTAADIPPKLKPFVPKPKRPADKIKETIPKPGKLTDKIIGRPTPRRVGKKRTQADPHVYGRRFRGVSKPSLPPTLSVPSIPSKPSTPSIPSIIGKPSYPSVPSVPSIPSIPSIIGKPSLPSTPSQPSEPSYPSVPSVPSIFVPTTPPTKPLPILTPPFGARRFRKNGRDRVRVYSSKVYRGIRTPSFTAFYDVKIGKKRKGETSGLVMRNILGKGKFI